MAFWDALFVIGLSFAGSLLANALTGCIVLFLLRANSLRASD